MPEMLRAGAEIRHARIPRRFRKDADGTEGARELGVADLRSFGRSASKCKDRIAGVIIIDIWFASLQEGGTLLQEDGIAIGTLAGNGIERGAGIGHSHLGQTDGSPACSGPPGMISG